MFHVKHALYVVDKPIFCGIMIIRERISFLDGAIALGGHMKIPEKVKIGWREYAVVEDKAITNSDGYELLGRIDYDENEIYLCNQAKPENKIVTLLHEILHGIFYMAGRKENCADEGLIDCLSENLYQVIKDNPEMFT